MIRIDIGAVKINTVSGSVNFGNTLHAVNPPSDRDGSPEGEVKKKGVGKKQEEQQKQLLHG